MRLLLITGAGASRNLNAPGSSAIVLMDGWAAALRERFGVPLSELLGLHDRVTGQEFEEHLGELLRWLSLAELNEKFAWMASGTDSGRDAAVVGFTTGLENAKARGERFVSALHDSLFAQFGPERFDGTAATNGYNRLLSAIGDGSRPAVVCATTNYDRSLELAFEGLDYEPRTGFRYGGIHVPRLVSEGLGAFDAQKPSVIYLHGAVGWYRAADGGVVAYPASDRHRPDLGAPAVLYPSKEKSIEDSIVADLWIELDAALRDATHVLVMGHALGDDHLVRRLRAVAAPLAVTFFTDDDRDAIARELPNATQVRMDFGPAPDWDDAELQRWASA